MKALSPWLVAATLAGCRSASPPRPMGPGAVSSAEPASWVQMPAPPRPRATLIAAGDSLMAVGGVMDSSIQPPASAEVDQLDRATRSWRPLPPLGEARYGHAGIALADGRVLVAGGGDGTRNLASAEVYDPRARTWTARGPLAAARIYAAVGLVPGCGVAVHGGLRHLVVSGRVIGYENVASTECFDAARGQFFPAPSPPERRQFDAVATAGRLVLVGGIRLHAPEISAEIFGDRPGPISERLDSAAIFDGTRWTEQPLPDVDLQQGAVAVGGRVYYFQDRSGHNWLTSFDPASGARGATQPVPEIASLMGVARYAGRFVVVVGMAYGGAMRAFLFDPAANAWRALPPPPLENVCTNRLLPLADGSVYLVCEPPEAPERALLYPAPTG
jgi:Kelch motif